MRRVLGWIRTRDALVAAGGFLFKAHFEPAISFFGVVPVVRDGARLHHYDIQLGTKEWPILIGGFNTDTTVRALCVPRVGASFSPEELSGVRAQVRSLSRFLIEYGWPPGTGFDWITREWFAQASLFVSDARTLAELAPPGVT